MRLRKHFNPRVNLKTQNQTLQTSDSVGIFGLSLNFLKICFGEKSSSEANCNLGTTGF
jgi:hypothetical protein